MPEESTDEKPTLEAQSSARQTFRALESPNLEPGDDDARAKWLDDTTAGFVTPGAANRAYYRVFLEILWPAGHSIPGPYVTEEEIRGALSAYRISQNQQPYRDPFRRLRELQGEEGLVGVGRQGRRYQLVDLNLAPKRVPRQNLSPEEWKVVLARYGNKCASCGLPFADGRFQQDHKIPRLRGGGNEPENWQPLCTECNNFKSTACRGCGLDCNVCPWAFPETRKLLRIAGDNIQRIRKLSERNDLDPDALVNSIIEAYLDEKEV